MLNTNVKLNNEITFNSVAGTLIKSCSESKFTRFHMNSDLAAMFFDRSQPHRNKNGYGGIGVEVEVLQVMLCGGDNFLVEYVDVVRGESK